MMYDESHPTFFTGLYYFIHRLDQLIQRGSQAGRSGNPRFRYRKALCHLFHLHLLFPASLSEYSLEYYRKRYAKRSFNFGTK